MIERIALSAFPAMALALALLTLGSATARADRCDDMARDLAQQISGLKVGKTVAGVIYLEHPAVTQASLGCQSRNRTNEVFAANYTRCAGYRENSRYPRVLCSVIRTVMAS